MKFQPHQSLPVPGTLEYKELPQYVENPPLPFRRTIRRQELHQIVPLAETTIYDMERRGEFPRRFNLTPRCVVWDLEEVEAWIEERKRQSRSGKRFSCMLIPFIFFSNRNILTTRYLHQ
ncbi:MAG: AlpA family phage regulatory protein [Bacillus sp. (in: Bacteria)]|nr:AlpA family phage regulatory protein [Bacillus sp. (in: firmicutes)]